LTFGAWCDRQYGFEYEGVRRHKGIAWFPLFDVQGQIQWKRNENYNASTLHIQQARSYPELNLQKNVPIYTQFEEDNERFLFVTRPDLFAELWNDFF
jgi:glucose-6-phosphate isomerase